MLIITSKILVITLILMAFIGQIASATDGSCQMDTERQTAQKSLAALCMTATDHTSNLVNNEESCGNKSKSTMSKSCEQDKNCSSGEFASVILFTSPIIDRDMAIRQKRSECPFFAIRQFPTTLYRPPIPL